MARVVVFGTGEQAALAHYFLTHDSPHEVVAFTADRAYCSVPEYLGLPVVPFEDLERSHPPAAYELFILTNFRRMNHFRAERFASAKSRGYRCVSYVSSRAHTWPNLTIGENCCITPGNTIDPFVEIGDDVVLWSGNHVGHHSRIGDHAYVTSHVTISGDVRIEPFCVFGVNATIRDRITIAHNCLVGAGALVLRDTKPFEVYKAGATVPSDIRSDQLPDRVLASARS